VVPVRGGVECLALRTRSGSADRSVCPNRRVLCPTCSELFLSIGVAASRPVRRILYGPESVVAIHLGRQSPDGSCGLPGGRRTGRPPPVRPCSRWGLPSHPGHPGCWCALTAPFHPYLCAPARRPVRHRRSALCCTFLRVAPTGCYPAPCPVESGRSSEPVPSCDGPVRGHPADSLPWTSLRAAGPGSYGVFPSARAAEREPRNPPNMPRAAAITIWPNNWPGRSAGL
jgi:hypothetical protein